MKKTLIAFATGWGPQHGGINSLNIDLLCAFQALHGAAAQTICIVLHADETSITQARQEHGVALVSLGQTEARKLGVELEPLAWERLQAQFAALPEDCVWLGHDSITGAIALAAKEKRGGVFALIHHMSYDHYESYAASSSQAAAKTQKQKELFAQADVALAVGPLLRDELQEWRLESPVTMLVPGLADELLKNPAKTKAATSFVCFLSGRLSVDAQKVKQTQLGIAAFGHAIKQADANSHMPSILKRGGRTKLLLRGVDFEDEADGSVSLGEQEFQAFASEYAGRAYPWQALPYTHSRATLFSELCSASVALMPSWHEGFGLVGWEAIAAGVPLVVSINSGLYRLLEEWEDGFYKQCVVPLDVLGLVSGSFTDTADLDNAAKAITQIALDAANWQKKAERLRRALEKEFTWHTCAQTLSLALAWEIPATPSTDQSSPVVTTEVALIPPPLAASRIHHLYLPEKRWQRGSGLDSYLLRAEEAVIPFDAHREPFLQTELAWATDSEFTLAVRLLVGEGGVGKTRLAQEICQRLIGQGWQAGFLHGKATVKDMKEFVHQLQASGQACLVVLDYAECRQDTLRELIKHLQKAERPHPVRLLLLARDGTDWWRLFTSKDAECSAFLSGPASSGPFMLPKLHDSLEHRQAAFQVAIKEFALRLGKTAPEQAPELSDEHYAHPLYIQMAALASLFGEKSVTAESLPALIRDHELRYWDGALRTLPNYSDLRFKQAQCLMAYVILSDGKDGVRGTEKLWRKLWQNDDKNTLSLLFDQLAQFYPNNGGIAPLRPDLLGEALVAHVLLMQFGPQLLDACLASATPALRFSSMTVLARIANKHAEVLPRIEQALLRNFSACALEAVFVCIATPNPLVKQLDIGFSKAKPSERVKFAEMLRNAQAGKVEAMQGLMKMTLKAHLQDMGKRKAKLNANEKNEYLKLLRMMAELLLDDEEWAAALVYLREAESMLLGLGGAKTEEQNGQRGSVLAQIAQCLNGLLKNEEALIESDKALKILAVVAKNKPQQYRNTWPASLANHALYLAALERADEAWATSAQAVDIYAMLVVEVPKKFEGHWANSLYNHAIRLVEMGRVEEALATSEQAVEMRAKLAVENPKKFEGVWADSLHNHAIRLAEMGSAEEAFATSAQAVELRAKLTIEDPKKFEGDWASSLNNHAGRLAEMGRAEEALATSAQAVELRAKLAVDDPKKFEGEWADSLDNHAIRLAEIGEFSAAHEMAKQSLFILQRCVERDARKWQDSASWTALNLSLWSYLENAEAPLLLPELALVAGGKPSDQAKLRFFHAFLCACAQPAANAVQTAWQYWQALNPVQQHAFVDEGIMLALLLRHYLVEQFAPAAWQALYQRRYQNRQGRLPVWMNTLAARLGLPLPSELGWD